MKISELTVLVAEDHALVRQGLVALLADSFSNIIEVDNGEDALDQLKRGGIELALIDIGLPRRTGLDVLKSLRARGQSTKVIILTGETDIHSPREVYAAGADAFLYKTAQADHFLDTVIAVANGDDISNEDLNDGDKAHEVAQLKERLSERELQIVKLVVEGLSNKLVSEALFISEHTVRKHREHINKKLSIRSPLAMARFAIKAGLV